MMVSLFVRVACFLCILSNVGAQYIPKLDSLGPRPRILSHDCAHVLRPRTLSLRLRICETRY